MAKPAPGAQNEPSLPLLGLWAAMANRARACHSWDQTGQACPLTATGSRAAASSQGAGRWQLGGLALMFHEVPSPMAPLCLVLPTAAGGEAAATLIRGSRAAWRVTRRLRTPAPTSKTGNRLSQALRGLDI